MIKNFQEILASGKINLQSLEQHRAEELAQQKKESTKWLLIIGGVLLALLIVSIFTKLWAIIIIGLIVGLVVYFLRSSKKKKKLEQTIKNDLIKNLIHSIDDSLIYKPTSFVNSSVYKDSHLIKHWSIYGGEDYFKGSINNISFEFSEITIQVKRDKSYTTIFQGPFFAVDFPQGFTGRTSVLPDTMEKLLGGLGRAFQKMNLSRLKDKLIKIDNVEFEKLFAVYSREEAESMQILQPNLCSLLLDERNKTGKRGAVYFGCSGNKFYIGLYNYKDIFAINIKQEINEANLQKYYDEFVEYMNLVINVYSILEENMQAGINTAPPIQHQEPVQPNIPNEPKQPINPNNENKFNKVDF